MPNYTPAALEAAFVVGIGAVSSAGLAGQLGALPEWCKAVFIFGDAIAVALGYQAYSTSAPAPASK